MKSLYSRWYKCELNFEYPSVLLGDKEGKIRYKYCKYFLLTYLQSIDLLPEFSKLRKYIKQQLNVDVYGALVDIVKVRRDNSYKSYYILGALDIDDIYMDESVAMNSKLLQLSEYIKNISNDSNPVVCCLKNAVKDLRWMFLVDTIELVKNKYSDRFNIYDISINWFCDIDVIFNFDEDLIKCKNEGIVQFLADEIRSEYTKNRTVELKNEELRITFTSFETDTEKLQQPYKATKVLFDGHGLSLNMEKSISIREPIAGDELLYLKIITDARDYKIIEGKWYIQPVDKHNNVRIKTFEYVYPPNTEINENNWYEYVLVSSEHEDYPKCLLLLDI